MIKIVSEIKGKKGEKMEESGGIRRVRGMLAGRLLRLQGCGGGTNGSR